MTRLRDQKGSTMVMVVGIVAALAIMGTSLVVLTANVQSNTFQDRMRITSFSAAESASDTMMRTLGADWPDTAVKAPTFTTADATAFVDDMTANGMELLAPAPGKGPAVSVQVFDDYDWNGDGTFTPADGAWDRNLNDYMYVEAQAASGDRVSRVQSQVQRTYVNTTFPRGIAVYTGGLLESNGGGNNPKITVEDKGTLTQVSGYAAGGVEAPDVFEGQIVQVKPPATVPSLDSLLPQATLNQIIALADSLGTHYYTASPPSLEGIVVVEVPDGTTVSLGNSGSINSLDNPGILLVLGGPSIAIDMGGNMAFYGVLYTDGRFYSAHGNPEVHGMVICKSNLNMKGTADIYYNDSCIARLANKWTLTVKQVPNTWRELTPAF